MLVGQVDILGWLLVRLNCGFYSYVFWCDWVLICGCSLLVWGEGELRGELGILSRFTDGWGVCYYSWTAFSFVFGWNRIKHSHAHLFFHSPYFAALIYMSWFVCTELSPLKIGHGYSAVVWSSSQSTLPFFLTSSLAVGSGVLLHLPKISFCCEMSFVYIDFCSLGFLAYANEEFFFCYCEKLLSLCFTFDSFKGNLNSIYFFPIQGKISL